MIFFTVEWLEGMGLHVPAVFTYSSTRMALALVTAMVLCVGLGPVFIRALYRLKIGQPIRKGIKLGELHKAKENTPTMGGVLMLASMVVSLILWMNWHHMFTLILLLTTVVLGGVGGFDDFLKLKGKSSAGLSGRKKLLVQVAFAVVLTLYLVLPQVTEWFHVGWWFAPPFAKDGGEMVSLGSYVTRVYVPFLKEPLFTFGLVGFGFFVAFVIAGTSNAVNLTDGLDGLAVGLLALVGSALAAVAFVSNNIDLSGYLHILYIDGAGEIAIYLAAFVGACLGFLWYNGHPAQVFMGDTGSLAMGGILGVAAILMDREVLMAVMAGVFVVETLSVILQVGSFKLRKGKRIFLCAPLHHHFEYAGWPETKVVVRFWIVGLLLAVCGVASLKFQ